MPQTKLYLGSLPEDSSKEDLQPMFEKYGDVVEFDILGDYGFIHFKTESEANAAAAALDGNSYHGANIRVEVSRSKVRQKAGMGDKGGCYRCGGSGHWSKECPRGPSSRGGYRGRDRDGFRGRGGRGDNRYHAYERPPPPPPFYDDFDYFYRTRMMMSAFANRYRSFDPYDLPPLPPLPGRDPYARPGPEYYRRSPPRDFGYYDRFKSLPGEEASGASADSKPTQQQNGQHNGGAAKINSRVPGPY